jgi:predicted Zn finger-like uncharacterized protein
LVGEDTQPPPPPHQTRLINRESVREPDRAAKGPTPMLMLFTCEHCGTRIRVDARSQGKRGRCSNCGQVMRIPHIESPAQPHAPAHAHAHAPAPPHATEPAPASEAPFRLSPPEPRPEVFREPPVLVDPAHLHPHIDDEPPSQFELLEEDADPETALPVSPEIQRGLRELAEFQKDQRPYALADTPAKRFFLRWGGESGPAGWLYTKWRAGISHVLRLLRWVDDWAYLISVPFIILAVFGIAIENRGLVHAGAVGVFLANYGRFWADLLAIFVRPFKEGPLHGLAFLFPPYGIYYLATRWDQFQPTFRRLVTSCIPIVLVVLAYAYLPSVNPAVKDVHGVRARLRSGTEELGHEIREDVKRLESKLPSLGRPKTRPAPPAP